MGKIKRATTKANEKSDSKADKQKKKSQEGKDTKELYSKIFSDATDSDDGIGDDDQEEPVITSSKPRTKTPTSSKEKLKNVVPALPNEHSDSSEDEGDDFEFDDDDDEDNDEEDESDHSDVIGEEKTLGEEMQHEDEDEEDEVESEEEDETEKTELRRQLKDLSFEELEALKQKMGLKEYNEAMFGRSKSGNKNATGGGHRKKRKFERINKHRPKEMSSKARVPKLRQVVAVLKRVRKDPRFEDSCGEYKEELWNEHYGFIRDMQKEEAADLKKKLRTVEDRGKKREIRQFIQRVTDKDKAIAKKQQETQKSLHDKLENRKRVEEGKKPFYMKKSTQKLVDLVEKYNELKASGGLDKYMKKKRKKNAARDRQYLKPLKK